MNGNHETIGINKWSSQFAANCIHCGRKILQQLQKTKQAIYAEFREKPGGNGRLLSLALTEAEALAWNTGYPQLVFPLLAMEKAEAVSAWQHRQTRIRRTGTPAFLRN